MYRIYEASLKRYKIYKKYVEIEKLFKENDNKPKFARQKGNCISIISFTRGRNHSSSYLKKYTSHLEYQSNTF